jgi:HAD superfamily hydrolase (TIGR01509 family)
MENTIKLIVFDLDGTLVDSRDTHYVALNMALRDIHPKYEITLDEHYSRYDGLSTTQKLNMLTKEKNLPQSDHKRVWALKQQYTAELVMKYEKDERLCHMLAELKKRGYLIYIASNCIWKNLILIAERKGFIPYIDWVISNEDVLHPKPSPEMYLKCIIHAQLSPKEVLIVEDSPIGRKSALNSGAHLLAVVSPADLSLSKVINAVEKMSTPPVSSSDIKYRKKCNVVIPMAGHGSRFSNAGYTFPKPLIDVKGRPMIEVVVRNLGLDPETAHFIFIVQEEHYRKYDLQNLLSRIAPGCDIVQVSGVTEGAACSVLLAKQFIDNDTPLVLANSDQFVEWDANAFFYQMENVDGGIATFSSSHPKWSYAKLDEQGFVSEVAEKKVISEHATVGIYYYRSGANFVKYAEQMIAKNIRVNNEFYVCPIFNEFIQDGKKVRIANIQRMWGIGVPEDLEYFLSNYTGQV